MQVIDQAFSTYRAVYSVDLDPRTESGTIAGIEPGIASLSGEEGIIREDSSLQSSFGAMDPGSLLEAPDNNSTGQSNDSSGSFDSGYASVLFTTGEKAPVQNATDAMRMAPSSFNLDDLDDLWLLPDVTLNSEY